MLLFVQKSMALDGRMDGWFSRVKDCLQQSKSSDFRYFCEMPKIRTQIWLSETWVCLKFELSFDFRHLEFSLK